MKSLKVIVLIVFGLIIWSNSLAQRAYEVEFARGEVFITLKANISNSQVSQILSRYNLEIVKTYSLVPNTYLVRQRGLVERAVAQKDDRNVVQTLVSSLKAEQIILNSEPNYRVYAIIRPNDPGIDGLYAMNNLGQTGGTTDADIDAYEAWDITTGDTTVIVGIIDSGIDYDHPDLAANIWKNPGEIPNNNIDDDGNGYVDDIYGWDWAYNDNDPSDYCGHGTHCGGTVSAVGNNGEGVAGVAWKVKLMALKFLDDMGYGYTSGAISALEYATSMGAKLTSNSWGGGSYSSLLETAIANSNILFIAAAGNESSNNDFYPAYPASYALDNIIAVAATDHNDDLAYFSNYGAVSVDLGAPGVDILSTKPDNPTSIDFRPPGWGLSSTYYGVISGTSMATPHVAGTAALIYSRNPSLTWAEAKTAILDYVDPNASLNGITVSNGRLNVYNAVWNVQSGIIISSDSLDFGTIGIGETAKLSLEFINATDSIVTINFASDNSVFSPASSSILVNSGRLKSLDILFSPSSKETYTGILTCDAGDTVITVDMVGTGDYLPIIVFSPDKLNYELSLDDSSEQTLTISNSGLADLTWYVSGMLGTNLNMNRYPASYYKPIAKGAIDTRVGKPVISNSGGPDTYGYTWIDSDEKQGLKFEWIDISSTGTQVTGLDDDNFIGPFPIGFSFHYYGNDYTEFYISSNGYIGFGPTDNYSNQNNDPIPRENSPDNFLAWCWDDLESKGGSVYYESVNNKLIVQFIDYGEFGADGKVTAEVILHANGTITFQYLNLQNGFDVLHSTVGIENGDGTDGLEVVFNNRYLHDSLAVQFSTNQWLSVTPQSGTIAPGGSQQMVVSANSKGLISGTYQTYLVIFNNDLDKNPANIPVTMTVDAQKIRFSVNMSIYASVGYFNPELGDYVTVPGSFNDWADDPSYRLTDVGGGVYEGTFPMYGDIGDTLQYKYFINAGDGRSLPNGGWEDSVDVYGGSDGNRGFILSGSDQRLPTVYFNNNDIGFPEILVTPDSFNVTLVEGDSVSNLMNLNNSGEDSLSYKISIKNLGSEKKLFELNLPASGKQNPDGNIETSKLQTVRSIPVEAKLADLTGVKILWDIYHGQDDYYYWSTIINDLKNRGAIVDENYTPITLTLLSDYDILWTTDVYSYFQQSEINAILDWVNSGGALILEGDNTTTIAIFNEILAALGSGIVYSEIDGTSGMTSNIFPHQTTQGISQIFLEGNIAHLSSVNSPGSVLINDMVGVPNTAYSIVSAGKVIAMADEIFHDYHISYGDNQLFGNQLIDWLLSGESSFWLTAFPDSGKIAPGNSQDIEIAFNASTLSTRKYHANLIVDSNDPVNTSIEVPVKLTILMLNPPKIEVNPDSFIVELDEGDSTKKLIKIENLGTGDLNWEIALTSISSTRKIYKLNKPSNNEVSSQSIEILSETRPVIRTSDILAELEDLTGIKILWDMYHGQSGNYDWSTIINDLRLRGATVLENFNPITPGLLNDYDILWSTDLSYDFTVLELNAIKDWVNRGGSVLLEGDYTYSVFIFNSLLNFLQAGIVYDNINGTDGITSNIYPHKMTTGVSQIYLYGNYAHLSSVTNPAQVLIEDVMNVANTAYSQVGSGRILVMADEVFSNYHISSVDNQLFANQAFDWLAKGSMTWLTFVPKSGSITPSDYHEVKVKINALNLSFGKYEANLTIKSNDPDENTIDIPIQITVYMPNPPKITVSPDSFNLVLSEGDTTVQKLVIGNEGVGDLEWSVEVKRDRNMHHNQSMLTYGASPLSNQYKFSSGEEAIQEKNIQDMSRTGSMSNYTLSSLNDKIEILAWAKFADIYDEYQNTLDAISQYYYNYTVTTTIVTDSSALRTALAGKDIFLIPKQEGGDNSLFSSLGSSWKTVLNDFVKGGGTVILCGSTYGSEQILNSSGLMSLDYYTQYSYGTMAVLDTTHFVTQGLPSLIPVQQYTVLYNVTDSQANVLVKYANYATIAAKNIGNGHVVLIGYDFYYYDDNAAKIISNAVKWSAVVNWISLTPNSGTVVPQDSDEVSLTVDASTLIAGFYRANLIIKANDPESQVNNVPVNLTVRVPDPPDIFVSPDSVVVQLAEGDSTKKKLVIGNNGPGKLKWSIKVRSQKVNRMNKLNSFDDKTQILAWTKYADIFTEYPNTLEAISRYYTDFEVTISTVTDSSALRTALVDKDVLLIPKQEGGSRSTFSSLGNSWKTVLHDFVNHGGKVILCGSNYGSEQILYSSELMNLNYWGRYSYGELTVLDTTHFITKALPSLIPIQRYTVIYNIADLPTNVLVMYRNYAAVAVKEIGNGHVILVGYDFYQYDDNAARIISNTVKGEEITWLTVAPLSGTVVPSDTQEVNLNLTAKELSFGSYEALISVRSNDPDSNKKEIDIPLKLNVYDPDPPKITVMPDSFNVELSVGDSTTQKLVIGNEGTGDLNWSIEVSPDRRTTSINQYNVLQSATGLYNQYRNLSRDEDRKEVHNDSRVKIDPELNNNQTMYQGPKKILAWTKYVNVYAEYRNMLDAISQYFTDYVVTTTTVTDSAILRATLVDKDILLIPNQKGGNNNTFSSLGNSWKTVLHDFVYNGGIIILCGSNYGSEQILKSSGLMNLNYFNSYTNGTMIVLDTTHYATKGLAASIPVQQYTMCYNMIDVQANVLVKNGNLAVVATKNIGFGQVVLIGYDFYRYDENAARIISNAVKWSTEVSWLSLNLESGIVAPQDTQEVCITVNASGLSAGSYRANLRISSNDPQDTLITIPFNLSVLVPREPEITVNPDSFYINLSAGDSTSRTLAISNSGSGDLVYHIELEENVDLSANPSFEETAESPGSVESDGDLLMTNTPSTAKIKWLLVYPDNGTVAPDSAFKINIGINAYHLTNGIYKSYFIIHHNDRDTESIKIPVILSIGQIITGVEDENSIDIPKEYALSQNYPNPFNPVTNIKYQLPESGNVTLKIYDILGREVITLVREKQKAGYYDVQWNGKDRYGMDVSSGVYLYVIKIEKFVKSRKMILVQ